MNLRDYQILTSPIPWNDAISLRIFRSDFPRSSSLEIVTGFSVTRFQEELVIPDDANLSISRETAQGLMDSLWQSGLRPTEGSRSAGSLKATEDHLATVKSVMGRLLTMVEKKS